MASGDNAQSNELNGFAQTFKPSDFGLNAMDLQDMDMADEDDDLSEEEEEEEYENDPFAAERKRRQKKQDMLKRNAGEPEKPVIEECQKMMPQFLSMLRMVLSS